MGETHKVVFVVVEDTVLHGPVEVPHVQPSLQRQHFKQSDKCSEGIVKTKVPAKLVPTNSNNEDDNNIKKKEKPTKMV